MSRAIEDSITISRPVADVFAFYRAPANLARFLGDVVEIVPLGGSSWRWTVIGPLGVRVHWVADVTGVVENKRISYETGFGWFRTRWDVRFSPGNVPDETVVREVLSLSGGAIAQTFLSMIGKDPAAEMRHNLNRLKQTLETGHVSDTANAVPGKFDPA